MTDRSWYRIRAIPVDRPDTLPERFERLRCRLGDAALYPVIRESPRRHRTALHEIARNFRREFHYDFIQYHPEDTDNYLGFLFYDQDLDAMERGRYNAILAFGGLCFRWIDLRDKQHPDDFNGWLLRWIWIHPFARHQGRMTRAWPELEKLAPGFLVEPPFSRDMESFLSTNDPLGLHSYPLR